MDQHRIDFENVLLSTHIVDDYFTHVNVAINIFGLLAPPRSNQAKGLPSTLECQRMFPLLHCQQCRSWSIEFVSILDRPHCTVGAAPPYKWNWMCTIACCCMCLGKEMTDEYSEAYRHVLVSPVHVIGTVPLIIDFVKRYSTAPGDSAVYKRSESSFLIISIMYVSQNRYAPWQDMTWTKTFPQKKDFTNLGGYQFQLYHCSNARGSEYACSGWCQSNDPPMPCCRSRLPLKHCTTAERTQSVIELYQKFRASAFVK